MTEEHRKEHRRAWAVFEEDDYGRVYLVAVRGDEESAIEEAWRPDVEQGLTWDDNLRRVEAIPDELADEADEPLSRGEPVLVRSPG